MTIDKRHSYIDSRWSKRTASGLITNYDADHWSLDSTSTSLRFIVENLVVCWIFVGARWFRFMLRGSRSIVDCAISFRTVRRRLDVGILEISWRLWRRFIRERLLGIDLGLIAFTWSRKWNIHRFINNRRRRGALLFDEVGDVLLAVLPSTVTARNQSGRRARRVFCWFCLLRFVFLSL